MLKVDGENEYKTKKKLLIMKKMTAPVRKILDSTNNKVSQTQTSSHYILSDYSKIFVKKIIL